MQIELATSPTSPDAGVPASSLRRMLMGYQVSQALHAVAVLGIADLLADGACSVDELAARTSAHAPTLYRLLRALASVGVFDESEARRFSLTPLSQLLQSGAPNSFADLAIYAGRPYRMQAWGGLLRSVATGENAFRHVHGTDAWSFRAHHPDEQAIFNRAMTSLSQEAATALLGAIDFGKFQSVADIGGGHGALLCAILAAHPSLVSTLYDQPSVAAAAEATVMRFGVSDRCKCVGGDFFESVPTGADAYILRAILHDWEDSDCIRILRSIRCAMNPDSRVLILEYLLGPPNAGAAAKFSDLNMLIGPGGRERTLGEFEALLQCAGMRLEKALPIGQQHVIQANLG